MKQGNLFILLLIFSFSFISSCDKNNGCTPQKFSYIIETNARIDTNTTVPFFLRSQVVTGSNDVFIYQHDGEDCPQIADEEYTRCLVFELPRGTDHFLKQDTSLRELNCYYQFLSMVLVPAQPVTTGMISGQKRSSGNWKIQADITLPGSSSKIKFDKLFVP